MGHRTTLIYVLYLSLLERGIYLAPLKAALLSTMSMTERSEWTESEITTAVFFASRGFDVDGIACLLQHRGHNRSSYATSLKLYKVRRLHPNLKNNSGVGWDDSAVDQWLLTMLSRTEIESLTTLWDEENDVIYEVFWLCYHRFSALTFKTVCQLS
jgi:hypothetical protein